MEYIKDFALPEILKTVRSINEKVLRDFVILLLLLVFVFEYPYGQTRLGDLPITPNSIPGISIVLIGLFVLMGSIAAHLAKFFSSIIYIEFLLKERTRQAQIRENSGYREGKFTGIEYADFMVSSILSDNLLTEFLISGNGRTPSLRLFILIQISIFVGFVLSMKFLIFEYFPHIVKPWVFSLIVACFGLLIAYIFIKIVYSRSGFLFRSLYLTRYCTSRISLYFNLRSNIRAFSQDPDKYTSAELLATIKKFEDFNYFRNFFEDPDHIKHLRKFQSQLMVFLDKARTIRNVTNFFDAEKNAEINLLRNDNISSARVSVLYNFIQLLGISFESENPPSRYKQLKALLFHILTRRKVFP